MKTKGLTRKGTEEVHFSPEELSQFETLEILGGRTEQSEQTDDINIYQCITNKCK